MAFHTISVFDIRCKNEVLKNLYFKSIIKCFKTVKIDKWPDLPYSLSPIDCCVRINGEADRLFSDDIQSYRYLGNDRINIKTFVFLAVYWSIWTSSYNTYINVHQFMLNGASTMLDNVFNEIFPIEGVWQWCRIIVIVHLFGLAWPVATLLAEMLVSFKVTFLSCPRHDLSSLIWTNWWRWRGGGGGGGEPSLITLLTWSQHF